jgi:hypothetical protein
VTTTGFWGMNLFSVSEEPAPMRLFYFVLILIPTIALTLYTVLRSRRLSDFFETLADERLSSRAKLAAWVAIWRRKQSPEMDHPDGT